jgi:PTH1 family peptidyl-tRNA hydrolase
MTLKLIVGLGNPGAEYQSTRHNVGEWFIQALAKSYNLELKPEKSFFGSTARVTIANSDIRLLVPSTFMNLSGKSIQSMASFYKIVPEEILVAHDELDIDVGNIKLKKDGGHGGHNGLRSIIQCLGNRKDFYRLRIGIGHPGNKDLVTPYVLGKPSIADKKLIENSIDDAVREIEKMVSGDWAEAMNQLHRNK